MLKKRVLMLTGLILLAGSGLTAAPPVHQDAIVARVGDKVITAFQVQQTTRREEERLARTLAGTALEKELVQLRWQALTDMIDQELVYLEFVALKGKIPPNLVQERVDRAVLQQAGGDLKRFEDLLHREQLSMSEFVERVSRNLAIEMLVYDRVGRGISIPDPQVRRYFAEHAADFARKDSYRLEVILLRKNGRHGERLQEVSGEMFKKLQEGVAFSELARSYSEGANAEEGGDQGWMDALNPELLQAVATLKKGEVYAGTVTIGESCYLVRLADFAKGSQGELTAEVYQAITERLTAAEENRRRDDFLRELRAKYPVRRMDSRP